MEITYILHIFLNVTCSNNESKNNNNNNSILHHLVHMCVWRYYPSAFQTYSYVPNHSMMKGALIPQTPKMLSSVRNRHLLSVPVVCLAWPDQWSDGTTHWWRFLKTKHNVEWRQNECLPMDVWLKYVAMSAIPQCIVQVLLCLQSSQYNLKSMSIQMA